MKSILTIFLFIGLSLTCIAQSGKEEIVKLEQIEAEAFAKEDFVILDKLLAQNYKVNSTRNSITRSKVELFGLMKSGKVKHPAIDRYVEEVLIQENVAISMGNETVKTVSGQIEKRRFTNIWIKSKEGWILSAAHHNIICQN